ncbi:MAG: hypothetical protein ACYC27_17525 [Armatimonadota bacterium]
MSRHIISALILLTFIAVPCSAEKTLRVLGGGEQGWQGWTSEGSGWQPTSRARMGDPTPSKAHMESSEEGTGSWKSPVFTVQGQMIRFTACGWDRRSVDDGSAFRLCLAENGQVLRSTPPPQSNDFTVFEWYVRDLQGKKVYFEAADRFSDFGYAWLGLARVEEIELGRPKQSRTYAAIPADSGNLGAWGILTHDAVGRPTSRFLSSACEGEKGIGVIRTPAFTVKVSKILLSFRGWDSRFGGSEMNRVEVVDEGTGEILMKIAPPLSDLPQTNEIDTDGLIGRKICLRMVDDDARDTFAWMGIDKIDAGEEFRVDFANGGDITGWRSNISPIAMYEQFGIPFMTRGKSITKEGNTTDISLGIDARRLFLLGMNTPDSSMYWVGDKLGEIQVAYEDGIIDRYPLTVGESLWWGKRFYTYPEPFTTMKEPRKAFIDSIKLYPQGPVQNGMYLASIDLRQGVKVKSISIIDDPKTLGTAVIFGLTAEVDKGATGGGYSLIEGGSIPDDLDAFIKSHSLRKTGDNDKRASERLNRLRNFMYCTPESFPKDFKVSIPKGYKGPQIRFDGDSWSRLMTNIFHYNADDMAQKVDPEGVYHTSTAGAAWYGYDGFGCFTIDTRQVTRNYAGFYYGEAWTRDLGRTLMELVSLGQIEKAKACADWCMKMARVWEEDQSGRLKINGTTIPRHICRIFQMPGVGVGEGCFENDGHGLTAMFIYNLWKRMPADERDDWLRTRWRDIKALGDWPGWQLTHKDISRATDVLWSDSEGSGWNASTGSSIYCDLPQIQALRGLASMAESIGQSETAKQWQSVADGLKSAGDKAFVEMDPKYGMTWTTTNAGFGDQGTMGPIILPTDLYGFDYQSNYPEWAEYNKAAYQRIKDKFHLNAMGYGEGFIIQSALLQDRMSEASELIHMTARAIYNPSHRPYIVPESVALHPDGITSARMGDLGNGVQQAEIVKAIRLMAGVDDANPSRLKIMPRILTEWNGVSVHEMPITVESGDVLRNGKLSYTFRKTQTGASFKVTSDCGLPETSVRLGAFKSLPVNTRVTVNGTKAVCTVQQSGDSWWLSFTLPKGMSRYAVSVEFGD